MVYYNEGLDYNFIEVNGYAGVKILTDPFEGVMYTYSNVSISDAEGVSDNAILSFNLNVVDSAGYTEEEFSTVEFKEKIGDILMSILQKSAENKIESKQTDFEESSL